MTELLDRVNGLTDEIDELADKTKTAIEEKRLDECTQHIADMREKERTLRCILDPGNRDIDAESVKILLRFGHEIVSPIQSLIGWLTLLEDRTPNLKEKHIKDVDKAKDSLATIRNRAHYILGPDAFEPTRLNDFVKDIHERGELRPREYKDVKVTLSFEPHIGEIDIDKGKMEIVLQNLVRNACEAGAKNIDIKTRLSQDLEHAYIWVNNDNSFIPKDKRREIFEPGATFGWGKKPGVKGTGVGLDTVKEYVEKHLGKIGVSSNRGKKETKFWVRIPNAVREHKVRA
jgi:signal transduction histidine kinase